MIIYTGSPYLQMEMIDMSKKIIQCPTCYEPMVVRVLESGVTKLFKLCDCDKEMNE